MRYIINMTLLTKWSLIAHLFEPTPGKIKPSVICAGRESIKTVTDKLRNGITNA